MQQQKSIHNIWKKQAQHLFLQLCLLLLTLSTINAQNTTSPTTVITGTVIDKNKEPLIGASVRIKGTKLYGIVNKDGDFAINIHGQIVKFPVILEVRYLGMKPLDVTCRKNTITVTMENDDVINLDNFVVTGYQRIDKRMLTSSVTSVKADEILTPGLSTIDAALEGRVPDMILQANSGAVGATSRIRVRGTSTILGNREPLWVVDGFIVTDPVNISPEQLNDPDFVNLVGNAIAGVNPQDIEQIDVLKDASATALYGTSAANGVIVITTKQGKEGPIRVTYDHISKFTQRPHYADKHTNLMNSYERVKFGKSLSDIHYVFPGNMAVVGYEGAYMRYQNGITNYQQFATEVRQAEAANTDWLSLLTQNSYSPSHNIQVQGGTRKMRYFTSLAYNKDNGTAQKEYVQRYSLRTNLNVSLSKQLRMNVSVSGNIQKKNHAPNEINIVDFAYKTTRALPTQNPDGTPYYYKHRAYGVGSGNQQYNYNIFNELNNSYNKYNGNSIGANLSIVYAPISELEFRVSGSYNQSNTLQERWWGDKSHYVSLLRNSEFEDVPPKGDKGNSYLPYGGILYYTNTMNESYTGRLQADYRKALGAERQHLITAMLGAEAYSNKYYSIRDEARGFLKERGLQFISNVDLEDYPLYKNWLNKNHRTINNNINNRLSMYMTMSYSLNRHFIANLNGRIDYSNNFGDRAMERFLPIWSISGRWNMHENLFKGIEAISEMSLKASYGKQGNMLDTESPNMIIRQKPIDPYYNEQTAVIERFPNPNLLWEETQQVNIEYEISLLKNRLRFSTEFYNKFTENAFTSVKVISTNGTENYTMNGADVINQGFNIRLSATPIRTNDWNWNLYFQASKNINRVRAESVEKYELQNYLNGTAVISNQSISTFYSYKFIGLNPNNGVPLFDDYQDRRHLIRGKSLEETVLTVMDNSGTRDPIFSGSFSNTLRYKRFTLSMNFVYNIGSKMRLFSLYEPIMSGVRAESNVRKEFLDRWMGKGDEQYTNIPSILSPGDDEYKNYISHYSGNSDEGTAKFADNVWQMYDQSDLRVVPGDYLRLSSMSFRYMFDNNKLKKTPIKDLTISLNAINLYTIASPILKGQNPMQAGFAVPQMSLRPTYTLQVNVNF